MKIDFHVHSEYSRDGLASLEEIAAAAKARGLDAVCICDHNSNSLDAPKFIDGVLLINGSEMSCKNAHVLGIGVDKSLFANGYDPKINPSIEEAVERIHAAGGLAVIAHPFAHNVAKGFNPDELKIQPDGVEIANGRAWMKNPDAKKQAEEYAAKYGLFTTGGSDAHCKEELGNAYTEIEVKDLSVEAIKEALKARQSVGILSVKTKRIYKGYSQLQRRKRQGRSLWKGYLVLAKCWFLDLLKC